MRKLLISLIVTLLGINLNAQNICGYTQEYVDSLFEVIADSDEFIEVLATENNQLITYTDFLSLENVRLTENNQRQMEIIQELSYPTDTIVFLQDTLYFKICDKDDSYFILSKELKKVSLNLNNY